MCCKVFEISAAMNNPDLPPIEKVDDEWCRYCKPGKGCTEYDGRPELCKKYTCMWMKSDIFPDFMKPSESKIVLNGLKYEPGMYGNAFDDYEHDTVVRALVSKTQKNVLKPGTKQRAFLDSLSEDRMVVIWVAGDEESDLILWRGREYPPDSEIIELVPFC